jgi:hypothetical protein
MLMMTEPNYIRLETLFESIRERMDRHEKMVSDSLLEQQAMLRDISTHTHQTQSLAEKMKEISDKQAAMDREHGEIMRQLTNCNTVASGVRWFLSIALPLMLAAISTAMWHYLRTGGPQP